MAEFGPLGVAARASELLHSLGIKQPTPVQAQTIPVALTGKDVISQAQTGTGKTLAFVLPMLERIKPEVPYLQGLIVTPTRELAIQITAEIKKLLPVYEGVRVLAVYGGQDVEAQLHKLEGNMHMIVATPGRLLDHMRRETVRLSNVRMMVLDEADQMLHMGFLGEVEEIMSKTPKDRQTMLFSATIPDKIRNLAGRYLRDPQEVTVKAKQVTVKDTAQLVIETTDRAKQAALVAMIEETQPYLGMVFCRTKRRASTLNEALQAMGYSSDELHGDLSQAKREQVMRKFREAKLQILVATDIAARGLDVEGVTHVYNYDVPQDAESYIHRIGRTGRAGESGMAITFVSPKDRGDLGVIEDGIGMFIERRKIGEAGGSVAAEGSATVKTRTPGAFGKRAGAAGAGSRSGATRGAGGGRRGESRGDDRGARGEGRGAVRGGVVRGARGDSAAALGGRGTAERGLRGGAANAGAGRGKGVPARGGRDAGAGGGAGEERAAKWWEQGEYFAPAPEERAAEPQAQRRRPGAGGPGNGRREAGAGRPQAAPGRGPRSGGSSAGEGRYAGASALGGRAERAGKPGAPAERPKRGGDRASSGRGERSFGAGSSSGGAGSFARGSERPSGGRSGGRPQAGGSRDGGRKPSTGGRGGFGGAPGGGAGRGKAPSRSPKGRK